jgi:hypothetical protein
VPAWPLPDLQQREQRTSGEGVRDVDLAALEGREDTFGDHDRVREVTDRVHPRGGLFELGDGAPRLGDCTLRALLDSHAGRRCRSEDEADSDVRPEFDQRRDHMLGVPDHFGFIRETCDLV